jgi:hypothetical protein
VGAGTSKPRLRFDLEEVRRQLSCYASRDRLSPLDKRACGVGVAIERARASNCCLYEGALAATAKATATPPPFPTAGGELSSKRIATRSTARTHCWRLRSAEARQLKAQQRGLDGTAKAGTYRSDGAGGFPQGPRRFGAGPPDPEAPSGCLVGMGRRLRRLGSQSREVAADRSHRTGVFRQACQDGG